MTAAAIGSPSKAEFCSARRAGGRKRRDPVHCDSIDINDPRCTRRRPFSNGTKSDADLKIQALVMTAAKHNRDSIAAGPKHYQGDLGHNGPKVLAALLRHMNWRTNTSDSALSQLEEAADGLRRDAIMARRDALIAQRYLGYQRRSVASGLPKAFGAPQRFQASSLVWPTPDLLPEQQRADYYRFFAELREERRKEAQAMREAQGMTRQQRAERRQARRRAALAERPEKTKSANTERSPKKLNPQRAEQALKDLKATAAKAITDEQAQADIVRANVDSLRAEMYRLCGRHGSG